jgi:uncharacterized protein YecE (DUF72 family)
MSIYCGTSSWSEKSWEGVFYPKGLAQGERLAFYATQFPSVEADVTYYRIPSRSMVEGWREKTPKGFVLSAKFPDTIVHAGKGLTPDRDRVLVGDTVQEDTERFLSVMDLLEDKCGPLVLQFPYFNLKVFKSATEFLERLDSYLDRLPKRFRYGVEVRNKNWVTEELLGILRKHQVAYVWVELPYMPHPKELSERLDLITTDFVYGRLIGDRHAVDALTKTFDRIVMDRSEGLEAWADALSDALQRVPNAYLYANNHYAGFGPETIRELRKKLMERGLGEFEDVAQEP